MYVYERDRIAIALAADDKDPIAAATTEEMKELRYRNIQVSTEPHFRLSVIKTCVGQPKRGRATDSFVAVKERDLQPWHLLGRRWKQRMEGLKQAEGADWPML